MTQAPQSLLESIEQDQQSAFPGTQATAEQGAMTAMTTAGVPARISSELTMAGISGREAIAFESKALALATSRHFLQVASDQIGMPLPGESEDSFVERAKDVFRNLLRKLLGGK